MFHADTPKIQTLPRQAQPWFHGARMGGTAKPPVSSVCPYSSFPFSVLEAKTKGKNFPQLPELIMEIHSVSGQ